MKSVFLLRGQGSGIDYARAFEKRPSKETIANFEKRENALHKSAGLSPWVMVIEVPVVGPNDMIKEPELVVGIEGVGQVS